MQNHNVNSADAGKVSSVKPEIDSSPKTYTLREQIVSGLKLAVVAGIVFMALWFFEKL